MCDTAVVVRPGVVLLAKNSDRDANEAQLLAWQPAREYPPGARLRTTWIEIPQARRTFAVLLSRPFWMWGAEMGANEHGVTIGNEAVFTRAAVPRSGLTGMDLLLLGLERGETAERAVEVMIELLEAHGQGGRCGHEQPSFRYFSSFLVADGRGALVLETAGRRWQVERVAGARSISNLLTIPGFAAAHGDRVKTWAAEGRRRRALTEACVARAEDVGAMMALLRAHGSGQGLPVYRWLNGAMAAPCMHAGGLLAASQTTASWVAELRPEGARHWVTATAAPCTGLFKPVRVNEPLALGRPPTDRYDEASLWWRHERLHRRVMRDPARLLPLYAAERDAVEARWRAAPPAPTAAFAEADALLGTWTERVQAAEAADERPGYVRRYWAVRDRRAGDTLRVP